MTALNTETGGLGSNVVKVGHKQVVSLIRQRGNRLLMKVVSTANLSLSIIRKIVQTGEKMKMFDMDCTQDGVCTLDLQLLTTAG
ncbi:SH3 and multiple ankyrin repeat domains protein 3 [Lates japonicus]|uniref:SH3 and multiple ankyrin repeat domains protein 3 n=1 Tax=Lates japonicus TaxID=270547 RepID=A0AAD3NL87_LATJO|nr:SH3 and multiple ankyrin repeat domains protein 3 [Lates japonicus]